jgi:hypothetical protein
MNFNESRKASSSEAATPTMGQERGSTASNFGIPVVTEKKKPIEQQPQLRDEYGVNNNTSPQL